MNQKIIWILITFLAAMTSCKEHAKGKFHVSGTYRNASATRVSLLVVPTGKDQTPIVLDSAKLSGSSGSFSLTGKTREQEIYEVVFGDNVPVPLINDADEIKVDIDMAKKDDYYEVTGSAASNQLKELISNFSRKNFEVEKNFAVLDSLKRQNASDSDLLASTAEKNNSIQDLNNYLKKFIESNSNATVSVLALGWGARSFTNTDFETELNSLSKKFPDNAAVQNMKKSYYAQKRPAPESGNSWVGKPYPELDLPDVNGKIVSLSSFKGKYLLVDFWASWCGPCRMENPNVVKAFNEFKGRNFTILGVSLDKDRDSWQQAIKDDKLDWAQVSDLKYWSSKAVQVFGFEGIPFNVLIDPQGKIIAQELRGPELENKLREVLQ